MDSINENIGKVSKNLMFKEAFYGLFLLGLNKHVTEDVKQLSVSKNGINCQLSVNPNYWKSLKDPHKEGALKHQLIHIAFQHIGMRDMYQDKETFDVAADLEANQYVPTENLPPDSVTLNSFPELKLPARAGVKVYYDALQKAKPNNPKVQAACAGAGEKEEHDSWDEFNEGTDSEKDLVKRQIDFQLKEVYESLKSRGLIPGELKAYIEKLFEVKEKQFNWKEYLRRYINGSNRYFTKKTRRKMNKRFPGNPAIKVKPKGRILIGVDTSGSVSNGELHDFFSEIYHAWKTGVYVDIVECDARIHPAYEYKGKWNGTVHGRGGTDFQPVIDYYNENRRKYSTLIYFTDGECSAPSKPVQPMLWVISSNITDYGKSVYESLPGHKFIIPKNYSR